MILYILKHKMSILAITTTSTHQNMSYDSVFGVLRSVCSVFAVLHSIYSLFTPFSPKTEFFGETTKIPLTTQQCVKGNVKRHVSRPRKKGSKTEK